MSEAEQITLFEPTGPELLDLAAKHERTAHKLRSLHDTLNLRGWEHAAKPVMRAIIDAEERAAICYMCAEFEALGGVA